MFIPVYSQILEIKKLDVYAFREQLLPSSPVGFVP